MLYIIGQLGTYLILARFISSYFRLHVSQGKSVSVTILLELSLSHCQRFGIIRVGLVFGEIVG